MLIIRQMKIRGFPLIGEQGRNFQEETTFQNQKQKCVYSSIRVSENDRSNQ